MIETSCNCGIGGAGGRSVAMSEKLAAAEARIFKALGHPSRIILVDALRAGERCVCELAGLVPGQLPTVSRHLSILKNAGILEDRKEGQNVYYRLVLHCATEFIACIAAKLEEQR